LLVLLVLAKLSGEDTPSAIADWVAWRAEGLKQALGLEWKRMPHQSTYRRLLQHGLAMPELEQMTGEFLGALKSDDELLNLDGETLRGTIPGEQTKGAHLLSLYQAETGVVLAQSSVGGKENECNEPAAAFRVAVALYSAFVPHEFKTSKFSNKQSRPEADG
jgi:hypothetical protein